MTEQKVKVELTWLQCQLPRGEWNKLNERRLKLNLKWADIIIPATQEYIGKLEKPTTKAKKAVAAKADDTNKSK